jgi:GDPmannose 4,6-dehydratase
MSFSQPEHTANVTGLGALRLLEAVRICGIQESVKIYQASSSEMFGKVQQTPQNENLRNFLLSRKDKEVWSKIS